MEQIFQDFAYARTRCTNLHKNYCNSFVVVDIMYHMINFFFKYFLASLTSPYIRL